MICSIIIIIIICTYFVNHNLHNPAKPEQRNILMNECTIFLRFSQKRQYNIYIQLIFVNHKLNMDRFMKKCDWNNYNNYKLYSISNKQYSIQLETDKRLE